MMIHNDDGRSIIAATQRLVKKRMISVSKSVFALHRMRGICAFSGALPFSSSSRRPRLRKTALRRRPNDEQRNRFMKRGQLCNDDRKSSVQDVPSLAMVKSMPVSYQSMDNISLATLGAMGNYAALQEMLKRHIMATDGVSYQEATDIYAKIEKKNFEYEHVMAFPFQAGIVTCFAAGCISIPLVFYLPAVEFFNEHFVTAEHPPTKELETWLEVGSWSWNWMEPVLGTSTFLLLCLQYMRMHLGYLGVHPYTVRMKRLRARNLADAFPQYREELLIAYSESSPFYNDKDLWF